MLLPRSGYEGCDFLFFETSTGPSGGFTGSIPVALEGAAELRRGIPIVGALHQISVNASLTRLRSRKSRPE